jgi:hypothetical protein
MDCHMEAAGWRVVLADVRMCRRAAACGGGEPAEEAAEEGGGFGGLDYALALEFEGGLLEGLLAGAGEDGAGGFG